MNRLGVFVGEHGHWGFFREIYADLKANYETQLFTAQNYQVPLLHGRLNRWARTQQIRNLLGKNDACFFEWASELLVPASHMPKRCPIITRLHSYEVNVWAPQINWDHVDCIIFVSNEIRRRFVETHAAHAAKTVVINNGVDLERFYPTPAKPFAFTIGILGTILPIKRVYEAIFTIATLRDRGYHPHLHIGGDKEPGGYHDDYYIAVQRLIEKLQLQSHVTMHGHVDQPQQWLRNIDIYLSNSYWEGQSVALLEAMASGCYALAHFWDGSEDILPERCIYAGDADLANRLIAYAELPAAAKEQQRTEMRALACAHYDMRNTADQIRRVIDATSSGRALPQSGGVLPAGGSTSTVLDRAQIEDLTVDSAVARPLGRATMVDAENTRTERRSPLLAQRVQK